MAFCLPIESTKKFLQALKEGEIVPEKLIEMSSEERRTFFEKIVGKDDAKEVNAQLESKLLLKDQKRGMVSWAKKVGGISEATRTDMISKISKMDNVLNADSQKTFLEDLASKKLGTDVTFEEARNIANLSKQVTEAKANLKPNEPVGSPARIDYGAKFVAIQNYIHELKLLNSGTTLKEIGQNLKTKPLGTIGAGIKTVAGIAKGINASFDNSYAGRQGFRAIFTNPVLWADNFIKSFQYIAKSLTKSGTDNTVMDGIKADIFSRPNAVDGTYKSMKLDVGINSEEAYPTALPEKLGQIPIVKNIPVVKYIPAFASTLYKASETAYNGMAMRLRADIADQVIQIAKNNGVDLTDKLQIESLGRLVNSLTGRGSLGSLEKIGGTVNVLFFSPKSLKASFDFLTLHATDEMSAYSRMQAAKNLLKVTAGIAVILGTAKALNPKSVELDPRSADFGKIKIGDTRFDVSGGMLPLVTLASRFLTWSSKSSTTGKVNPLNSGKFGSQTVMNAVIQFSSNKTSPLAHILVDYMNGQTFQGGKPTVGGEALSLITPLGIKNTQELMSNPNSANVVLAEIIDALGFVTNTYSPKKK